MGSPCWSRACCGRIRSRATCSCSGAARANLIKIVFWDGTGLCLFTKRLEHGVFLWPPNVEAGETLSLTSAQLVAADRRRGLARAGTAVAASGGGIIAAAD